VSNRDANRDRFLGRAWRVLREPEYWDIDPRLKMLWLQVALDIHQLGDGTAIGFGQPGNRYRSRERFLSTHECTEADLSYLFVAGLLVDEFISGTIVLPHWLGLARWRRPASRPSRAPFIPKVIKGGQSA